MAPKMAIRDIARVKQLPLNEADRLAKLVPMTPGTSFEKAFKEVHDLKKERDSGDELVKDTLHNAQALEGTIRNTGTHACGIIIGKDDLIDYIPLSATKDSDLLATQFDGNHIENAGMLKMDFLGLKTLSIIKDAVENVKHSKGIELDIEQIPYDDELTYELYSKGDTTGIFQFESEGMKKHLRDLKPNRFEDLIAMNALYRPGPMEYIPNYIKRKHGKEKIEYDIPEMAEILEETYGITVYQEQVMLLSQKLAKFTKGQADSLRKGMGKKKKEILDDLKPKFIEGCLANGIYEKKIEKIWQDWEAFAKYAFNKSHSTCYAVVSYRMAYLKAHYPAEFMAAVLSRNLNDIKKITELIDECKHQNLKVLGPDINESFLNFVVNKKGEIRFGMAAIKGVGEAAVRAIIEERDENGSYAGLFGFAKRINLRAVNKRSMEALAMAGAFDSFEGVHRAQYFYKENAEDSIYLEKIIMHANMVQERERNSQQSLFGGSSEIEVKDPVLPECEPWTKLEQLKFEKEVTGFYISGHPLDDFKMEIDHFCSVSLEDLNAGLSNYKNKFVSFAGMVTGFEEKTAKSGNLFGVFTIEDFSDTYRLSAFAEDYLKIRHMIMEGSKVLIKAKIEPNFRNPARLEVRVSSMILLADTMDKFTSKISVQFRLEEINKEFINEISQIVNANKGSCPLYLKVHDGDEKYSVDMRPKKLKVSPKNFVNAMQDFKDIELQIN